MDKLQLVGPKHEAGIGTTIQAVADNGVGKTLGVCQVDTELVGATRMWP